MSYCQDADVRQVLTGVGTDVMGTEAVASHINRADAIIDTKLGARFNVPFETIPPIVKTISTDIASFYVMRTLYTAESQNKSDWTLDLYNHANRVLDKMSTGELPLLDASGNTLSVRAEEVKSTTQPYTPIFDMGKEIDWRVDPDLISDIEREK